MTALSRGAVIGGARLTAIDSILGRVLSGTAQLVYGALLLPEDFALYGLSLALTFFVRVFQDGGVREAVIAAKDDEVHLVTSAALTVALVTNLGSALLLLAAARPLGLLYGIAGLEQLVVLVGVSLLANSGWAVSAAVLRRRLRFGRLVVINLAGSVAQFSLPVVLILAGMGVEAIFYGLIVANLIRSGLGLIAGRVAGLAALRPSFALMAGRSSWLIAGSMLVAIMSQGDYFALGLVRDSVDLGYYFFAFQIANQMFFLVAAGLQSVLIPVVSESKRQGLAYGHRLVETGVMAYAVSSAIGIAGLGLGLLANVTVWNEKWTPAMPLLFVFSLGLPLFIQYTLLRVVRVAAGQFREWATIMLLPALAVPSVVLLADQLGLSLLGTCLSVAGTLVFLGVWMGAKAVASEEGAADHYLGRLVRIGALSCLAALVVLAPTLRSPVPWVAPPLQIAISTMAAVVVLLGGLRMIDNATFDRVVEFVGIHRLSQQIGGLV